MVQKTCSWSIVQLQLKYLVFHPSITHGTRCENHSEEVIVFSVFRHIKPQLLVNLLVN
jgi:hypothetical protein